MPKLHTTITVPVTIHFDVDIGERETCDSPEVPLSITINDVRITVKQLHHYDKLGNFVPGSLEYNINTYALTSDIESELEELIQENEDKWQND